MNESLVVCITVKEGAGARSVPKLSARNLRGMIIDHRGLKIRRREMY